MEWRRVKTLLLSSNLSDLSHSIALILLPYEQCSVLKNISESVVAIVAPLGIVLSPL
jgi:hypothetical protein